MNAVILVGGGGTRLRPLTYAVPKPLIPVLNRPLISHLLDNLRRHGVDRVVFAASAQEKRIEEELGDGDGIGLEISYCYETEPLGSGLAVKQAAKGFDEPFFVCNGDVITDLDVADMAARHKERGAIVSISLAQVEDPSGYGVVEMDRTDRITRFVEKPPRSEAPSNFANAGTWIFDPSVLEHIPDEKMDRSLEQLVFPLLIADGYLVLGYPSDAYWMDVGTPERYLQLHYDLLKGRIPQWLPGDLRDGHPSVGVESQVWHDVRVEGRVILGRACRVGGMTRLAGPSVLGDRCDVRDKAVIERSVIWSNAKVGSEAVVRDSILGKGCWVGDGAVVEGAILADGAKVKRGVRLGPGARLEPDEVAG
ncbi:MAG TPA: NDP-sugar synthase [Dehalococcoidia bacterium]|nr:NDP-sugar synthase [Dehalococcoidia bacterium]